MDPLMEHDPELPSYQDSQSARKAELASAALSTQHQHESALYDSPDRKWLILRTNTRPRKPESLPIFREGDIISGEVELDLTKGENTKSITISVIGGTTFIGQEETIFLKETQTLWTRNGNGSKLAGKHIWPFTFALPNQVEVKSGAVTGKHSLPPTFTERASTAYVDYRLLVEIKRGGFLKVDKTLLTTFGYQINSISEPLSELRQLAYTEGIPLFGPEEDPLGWKALPPVKIKGTLSGKPVEVEITLAISNPTTYPIGYPIPLHITLTSDDTQALEELAKPTVIGLELVRSMATGADALDDSSTGRTDNYFSESEALAFWWSTSREDQVPNTRELRGELDVPRTVKPTFLFPRCSIRLTIASKYSLDLLPPTAPGWVNGTDSHNPLLSERITIVSRQAPGMKVRSDAPPGYDRSQAANYLKSVGLLENGNQRFLARHR